jgi:hypothetical protein
LLGNVNEKLAENAATFTDPPIPLATLTTLETALDSLIHKATQGSANARALRDNKVKQVLSALHATADYVRMVANGDAGILTASGFEMAKQREPSGPVGITLIKVVEMTGVVGEAEVIWTKVPGAYSYQLYRTDSDPAESNVVWTPVVATTKIRSKVNGLTPYKAYWFSVQALGAEGPGAMSAPELGRAA